jgi:RES domain-containing protein
MTAKKKTARNDSANAKKSRVLQAELSKESAGSMTPVAPPEMAVLSICVRCAKHPSLKRFVEDGGAAGYECGICHRKDVIASAPAKYEALCSLVRALIRFYYDEWTYNGHWGGNQEPESLLCHENEIVEHSSAPGFPRSAETSEEFLTGIFDPPYPDYDKGIAIYAGHHEEYGRLPPLNAISTSGSPIYDNIVQRLTKENYFEVEDEFEKQLAKLDAGICTSLPAGTILFRSRIGVAQRFIRGTGGWDADIIFQPYLGTDIGAPPPTKANPGRLNRDGVSFLYLSTDETTAAAEVRPHPGHRVSIGAFRCLQDIRIADFGAIDIADFSSSDAHLDIFHLGHTIGREISLPITPEDRHKYSATQLLADLRRQGYDGIRFPSSVALGANVCIFQPALFSFDPTSGKVLYVKGLKYEVDSVEHLIEPTDDDVALPS